MGKTQSNPQKRLLVSTISRDTFDTLAEPSKSQGYSKGKIIGILVKWYLKSLAAWGKLLPIVLTAGICLSCADLTIRDEEGRHPQSSAAFAGLCAENTSGQSLIEEGVRTLSILSNQIDTTKMKEPAFKMILTATGDYAYRRPQDGIYVVPIGCLRP